MPAHSPSTKVAEIGISGGMLPRNLAFSCHAAVPADSRNIRRTLVSTKPTQPPRHSMASSSSFDVPSPRLIRHR